MFWSVGVRGAPNFMRSSGPYRPRARRPIAVLFAGKIGGSWGSRYRQTDRQTDTERHRHTHAQTDRQIDRQTDRYQSFADPVNMNKGRFRSPMCMHLLSVQFSARTTVCIIDGTLLYIVTTVISPHRPTRLLISQTLRKFWPNNHACHPQAWKNQEDQLDTLFASGKYEPPIPT